LKKNNSKFFFPSNFVCYPLTKKRSLSQVYISTLYYYPMTPYKENRKSALKEICLNIVKLNKIKPDCKAWLSKMLEYVFLLNA